jgi:hypothetical protein
MNYAKFYDNFIFDYKFYDNVKYGEIHIGSKNYNVEEYVDEYMDILLPKICISNENLYEESKSLLDFCPKLTESDLQGNIVSVYIRLLIIIRSNHINYNRYTISKFFKSKVFTTIPSLSYLDWRFNLYEGGKRNYNESLNIVHCFNMLKEYKFPDENKCDIIKDQEDPSLDAFYYAHKTGGFNIFKIPADIKTFKWLIRHGYPIYCGIVLYQSALSKDNYFFGTYIYPDMESEKKVGAHPILIIGYNDKNRSFDILNGLSPTWGNDGYGSIPYSYIMDSKICGDIFTLSYAGYNY